MRRFLLAGAVLAALPASAAMAADMRVKAPVLKAPPPVAVFSWTGFYVGANIGYSWGRSRNDWNAAAPFFDGSTVCGPAGDALCISGSDSNKLRGAIGGLQAGYNWQAGNYVVGLETDFQLSGQRGSQHFDMRFPTSNPAFVGTHPQTTRKSSPGWARCAGASASPRIAGWSMPPAGWRMAA
jgi:outer membrane immunogenic protein